MTLRCPVVLAAALAICLPAFAGEPLTGPQIVEAVTGSTTSGINTYGNPYTVEIRPGGTTWGVAGFSNEYEDNGTWWVEGDSYCRRWTTWLEGQTACFQVFVADDKVTWVDAATGNARVEDYVPPQ